LSFDSRDYTSISQYGVVKGSSRGTIDDSLWGMATGTSIQELQGGVNHNTEFGVCKRTQSSQVVDVIVRASELEIVRGSRFMDKIHQGGIIMGSKVIVCQTSLDQRCSRFNRSSTCQRKRVDSDYSLESETIAAEPPAIIGTYTSIVLKQALF